MNPTDAKILIIVACHNRKALTRHALDTLVASKAPQDVLLCFNDGSTEYDSEWLRLWADGVLYAKQPIGIDAQRAAHFQIAAQRFQQDPRYTHLYLTDNDTLHDPHWRYEGLRIQANIEDKPLCLYNTLAHSSLDGNTLLDDARQEVIWRKYAPGVSYLLTVDHVAIIAPRAGAIRNWDWDAPDMLGNQFAISRVGYIDHVGVGGAHHPADEDANGGDRVIAPTEWLKLKRAEVVAELEASPAIA